MVLDRILVSAGALGSLAHAGLYAGSDMGIVAPHSPPASLGGQIADIRGAAGRDKSLTQADTQRPPERANYMSPPPLSSPASPEGLTTWVSRTR